MPLSSFKAEKNSVGRFDKREAASFKETASLILCLVKEGGHYLVDFCLGGC